MCVGKTRLVDPDYELSGPTSEVTLEHGFGINFRLPVSFALHEDPRPSTLRLYGFVTPPSLQPYALLLAAIAG